MARSARSSNIRARSKGSLFGIGTPLQGCARSLRSHPFQPFKPFGQFGCFERSHVGFDQLRDFTGICRGEVAGGDGRQHSRDSRGCVLGTFDRRQREGDWPIFARRQNAIQTETQSRDIHGSRQQRSPSGSTPTPGRQKGFPTQGWWRCGILLVARLTFLKWPPALFSRCIFSRHQTSTLRSLSKRLCRVDGTASQRRDTPWFEFRE